MCKVNNLSCYSKQLNTDILERKSEHGKSEALGKRAPSPQYTARSYLFMSPFFSKFTMMSKWSTKLSKKKKFSLRLYC